MAIFHKTLQYHEDTTKKRELNQEDVEFLKRLQLEMNTQDTTGTADPRFWVIKGSERAVLASRWKHSYKYNGRNGEVSQ